MLGFGRCFSFAETELPRSWNWSFAPLVSPTCWEKAVDTIEVIRRITKSNLEEMMSEIPLRRFAAPEEIAAAICFLAGPSGSYINGINLPVDGGRTGCL